MADTQAILDVEDRPAPKAWAALSLQHLFAMFGATVLVPAITGLNPAVALVTSGAGTLLYMLLTKGKIPAYLGSSFAFIAPILTAAASQDVNAALVGCFFAGLVYVAISVLIRIFGVSWLLRVLPPVVVGPVIMVIGLGLAGVAVNMATTGSGAPGGAYNGLYFGVALLTLAVVICCAVFLKNFFSLVPVLIGVVVGYLAAIPLGLVDFTAVAAASFIAVPDFSIPFVTYEPVMDGVIIAAFIAAAIVPVAEHIGDQMVLSKVVGRNFLKEPGLDRSILGDGVATVFASLLGGPPNTTYGENIGVLAVTRVFSIFVVGGAAVLAVLFGFSGKIAALIASIPVPVMGGVAIMLFGIIAASGLRMMVESNVDFSDKRNLIIASVILVIGVGGATIQITPNLQIAGMALAAITGVILNLVLPGRPPAEETDKMFDDLH